MPLVKLGKVNESMSRLVKVGNVQELNNNKPDMSNRLEDVFSRSATGLPAETLKEVPGIVSNVASTAMFGIPKAAVRRFKPELEEKIFPEQKTVEGKVLRGGGELAALFFGGAGNLARKAGAKVLSRTGSRIAQGAFEGAAFGASQLDVTGSKGGPTVKGQVKQAAMGAVTGGMFGALSKAKQSIDKATKGAPAFARKVREVIFSRKRQASELFGKQIDDLAINNPERTVSLRGVIDRVNAEAAFEPKLSSVVRRSPSFKKLADNPELADNVPVNEAQKIINEISSKVGRGARAGGKLIKTSSDDIPVFDVIDEIRGAQADAFPEMGDIRKAYAETIGKYNLIRGKIKEGSLLKNLATEFGDPELQKAAEGLMTKDLMKEVKSFKNVSDFLKTAGIIKKRAIEGAVIGGVGGGIASQFFGQR